MGRGFGGGMHPVLWNFMDTARRRFSTQAVEMIQRDAAFADGVALFDGFRNVGLGEHSGFRQSAAGG